VEGREQLVTNLVGDKLAIGGKEKRTFEYKLPNEINNGFYIDTIQFFLFSNGACVVFQESGNIDLYSNNHLIEYMKKKIQISK
jgi:hypothetical protein